MAQQINLYNPELRRQRVWLSLTNVAALALLFGVVLAAAGFVLHSQAAARKIAAQALEPRLVAARAEVEKLGGPAAKSAASDGLAREVADLKQQVAMRQEVLVALQGGGSLEAVRGKSTIGFADYLRGLARQSVRDLWLTGFSVGQGGEGMEVRGRMLVADRLPEYIKRLNGEPIFKGRQFVSLNILRSDKTGAANAGTPHSAFVLTSVPAGADGKEAKR